MSADQLEQEVLKLPAERRARLAERIVASLEDEAEMEREWLHEVKRRGRELEAAAVAAIPREDAPTSTRQRPRLVSFYLRPAALDEFIEEWKKARSKGGSP